MIKGLFFDLNGTLIDILTVEDDNAFRITANFLSYYGIFLAPEKLRQLYFDLNHQQRHNSPERFPEFDVVKIFRDIILIICGQKADMEKVPQIAESTALVFRGASRCKLELYPGVKPVLEELQSKYLTAAVSDGQCLWAVPEMRAAGLDGMFQKVIVSGDYGFRKPDPRMYRMALEYFSLQPEEVIFVGNDMLRDVHGAKSIGMKTVFFKSNQGDHSNHGSEPDYIIYDFRQLPEAIRFLEQK